MPPWTRKLTDLSETTKYRCLSKKNLLTLFVPYPHVIRALEDLSALDPKFPPDLRPMKRVKLVNGIVHLIQMHFQTTIVRMNLALILFIYLSCHVSFARHLTK